MISVGLAAVALVLTALYFVDYRRVASGPPSSGPGRDLITALQFLTGALGHQGSRTWPGSGWLAAAALGFTLAMFLRASRRQDKEGLTARGLFLAIGGIAGLALMVGHSRSGFSPFAGFFDRYSTLSCLFPVLVYAGTEFFARPLPGRVLRIAMACLMALLFLPNARHGWDILGQRRLANETLTRDVRAGLPPAMLARIHHPWHPGTVETLEEQLRLLAEARMAIFRRAPLSDSARLWETGLVPLVDCRIALDLRHDASFSPDLDPGWHEIQIDFGRLDSSAEDLRIVAHSRGRGGRSEEIWSSALGQSPHLRHVLRIRIDEGVRLSLETQGTAGSAARIWVLLEDRRIPAP
jgi:hypothetical protein